MNVLKPARMAPMLALLLIGCASGTAVKPPGSAPPGQRRVLVEELVATREPDLYEAITICRPTFLHPRNARGEGPALYVDGIAMAEMDAIHAISVLEVVSVEFMSGPDATTRYGTGHVGGALLVWTRRGRGSR